MILSLRFSNFSLFFLTYHKPMPRGGIFVLYYKDFFRWNPVFQGKIVWNF